jgi:hypothetical protein
MISAAELPVSHLYHLPSGTTSSNHHHSWILLLVAAVRHVAVKCGACCSSSTVWGCINAVAGGLNLAPTGLPPTLPRLAMSWLEKGLLQIRPAALLQVAVVSPVTHQPCWKELHAVEKARKRYGKALRELGGATACAAMQGLLASRDERPALREDEKEMKEKKWQWKWRNFTGMVQTNNVWSLDAIYQTSDLLMVYF